MSLQDPEFVLGPLATAGLLSFGWAAAKRSRTALAVGMAALLLETHWTAYQRFTRDRRFWALNLVIVRPDHDTGLEQEATEASSPSV